MLKRLTIATVLGLMAAAPGRSAGAMPMGTGCKVECDPDGPDGPDPGQDQGSCPEGQHEAIYCPPPMVLSGC